MWGIFKFFKENEQRWHKLDEMLTSAFGKLKDETSHAILWLKYFHDKDIYNDGRHKSHQAELYNQKLEIARISNELKLVTSQLDEVKRLKGQERTCPGTIEDMSKDKSVLAYEPKHEPTAHVYDRSMMSDSELEVLNVLYAADHPLGYDEIAKRVNKTPKSIRNLVYELRKKRVEVKDKQIGFRQKGFFLTKEIKIKISGR